jgi:hypothetical protein
LLHSDEVPLHDDVHLWWNEAGGQNRAAVTLLELQSFPWLGWLRFETHQRNNLAVPVS